MELQATICLNGWRDHDIVVVWSGQWHNNSFDYEYGSIRGFEVDYDYEINEIRYVYVQKYSIENGKSKFLRSKKLNIGKMSKELYNKISEIIHSYVNDNPEEG